MGDSDVMSDIEYEEPSKVKKSKKRKKIDSPASNSDGPSSDDCREKWNSTLNEILSALKSTSEFLSNTASSSGKKEERKTFSAAAELIRRNRSNVAKLFDEMSKHIAEQSNEIIKDLIWQNSQIINEQNARLEEIRVAQSKQSELQEQMLSQQRQQQQLIGSYASVAAAGSNGGQSGGASQRQQVKVAGLKKPVRTGKVFKIQFASTDSTRTVSGEELKHTIMNNIKPSKIGFRPTRLYALKDNRVILEAQDDCFERIKDSQEIKQLKVHTTSIDKINPRLTIFNVPASFDKTNLAQEIQSQNDIIFDEFMINPLFKFGKRDRPSVHWVVECNPVTRKYLLNKRSIVLGWNSCNIEERIAITKCFKCQGYSHTSSKCQNSPACGHCSGDHDTRNCKDLQDTTKIKCILCIRAKLEDNCHKPRDAGKCVAYRRKVENLVASIDFGDENVTVADVDFQHING